MEWFYYSVATVDRKNGPRNNVYKQAQKNQIVIETPNFQSSEFSINLLVHVVVCRITHSPINFRIAHWGPAYRSQCSILLIGVFAVAAFDSIRGCGETIYLRRCHARLVMDGGCTLTLTRKESLCQEPAPSSSYPLPHTYSHNVHLSPPELPSNFLIQPSSISSPSLFPPIVITMSALHTPIEPCTRYTANVQAPGVRGKVYVLV